MGHRGCVEAIPPEEGWETSLLPLMLRRLYTVAFSGANGTGLSEVIIKGCQPLGFDIIGFQENRRDNLLSACCTVRLKDTRCAV